MLIFSQTLLHTPISIFIDIKRDLHIPAMASFSVACSYFSNAPFSKISWNLKHFSQPARSPNNHTHTHAHARKHPYTRILANNCMYITLNYFECQRQSRTHTTPYSQEAQSHAHKLALLKQLDITLGYIGRACVICYLRRSAGGNLTLTKHTPTHSTQTSLTHARTSLKYLDVTLGYFVRACVICYLRRNAGGNFAHIPHHTHKNTCMHTHTHSLPSMHK